MGDFGQGVQLFALSGTKRTFDCKQLQEVLHLREELLHHFRDFLLIARDKLLLDDVLTCSVQLD